MTPDLLARAGQALARDDWQPPLARLLGPVHPDGLREEFDQRLVSGGHSGSGLLWTWSSAFANLLWSQALDLHAEADEAAVADDVPIP